MHTIGIRIHDLDYFGDYGVVCSARLRTTTWKTAGFTELLKIYRIDFAMSRFRHLLLCLMMLALPLQGFAAASMLYCGMGAGHDAKAVQTEIKSNHHPMADAMGLQHDHGKHDKTMQAVKQSPDTQKQLPDSTHKCGVCAACCSVIAIADFPQTLELQSSPKADLVEPFVLIHTVPSRLPEKPPRA